MSRILRAFLAVVSVLFLSFGASAQSQATTGSIQGTIVDPNGAIISSATVTVRNTETGFERTVTSNSDGFFSAPLLPLGKYRVATTASGFSETVLENVEVSVGQTLSLRIEMKIGGGVTTVDVSAEGEGVEVSRTELSTQINERSVENLPINRRDFSRFALLTPGVSIV